MTSQQIIDNITEAPREGLEPTPTMNKLKKLSELYIEIADLQAQAKELESSLESETKKSGAMEGFGLRAEWKPGRKSTDHEQAFKDLEVDAPELIAAHTTIRKTIAWARITKELGIGLEAYTHQGKDTFVIKALS